MFFVDDDEQLRSVTARLLKSQGYRVIEAGSAEQAVERLEQVTGRVDVLLIDINLPDGWGASVAQRLKQEHPEMAVVFTTGYADVDPILSGGLQDMPFVARKPFTIQQLTDILARARAT